MARLPTAEQLGQRPTPQPSQSISRLQLTTPNLGHVAQAITELGGATKQMGDTIMQLEANERRKKREVLTDAGVNEYSQGILALESDKTDGYENILGGEALRRPLMEEYGKKREALAKKVRDGLPDDEARFMFDRHAAIIDRQFDARLYKHVATQTRAYQGVEFENTLETETRMATQMWDQPDQIGLSLMRMDKAVMDKMRRDGLNPDVPEDRKVIEGFRTSVHSKLHTAVIETMLSQGKDSAAAAYFEKVKIELSPDALINMGNKVEASSVEGEAMRGADDVWAVLGPKSPNSPIRLDLMEQELRNRYKDDPRKARAAIQELRSRAVAHNDAQQELTASNKSAVLGAFNDGMDLKKLQAMPEYQALDGQDRAQVRDYVLQRGWTEQSRARQDAEYQDGDKARAGFTRYWELSEPSKLSTMSESQILALEPVLGRTLTGQLMEQRRRLAGSKQIQAATIDNDLFNSIAVESGLNPYGKQNASDKEKLGRLRSRVEAAISMAQEQKGGVVDNDTKEAIMRKVLQPKVMVDEWGSDPQMPAAAVPFGERGNIYVPIAEVDPSWLHGAINYMRSIGAAPMALTDAKIKQQFKDRLEKAYALSLTGGSPEEGRKILEGK